MADYLEFSCLLKSPESPEIFLHKFKGLVTATGGFSWSSFYCPRIFAEIHWNISIKEQMLEFSWVILPMLSLHCVSWKRWQCICDYNSGKSWWILINVAYLEAGMQSSGFWHLVSDSAACVWDQSSWHWWVVTGGYTDSDSCDVVFLCPGEVL